MMFSVASPFLYLFSLRLHYFSIDRQESQLSASLTCRRSAQLKRMNDFGGEAVAWMSATNELGSYRYEQLDEHKPQIRLLELLGGKKGDVLCGRLTAVNLEKWPQLGALIYGWVGASFASDSRLTKTKILMVPENLHKARITLRLKDESRTLWIDATCITQEEKRGYGHQVGLMRVITVPLR